ncbi:MAG: protein-L-isoaspartate(D-aspartate) O-methyltransferase [Anaerolineales bacterium]|nr:protein-L-isoaspartate(D-aspartate) O-methyltransferase [Anaerolineales bacterium]
MDNEATTFAEMRQDMVARQLAGRGIDDTAVLQAFLTVPRELFVPREYRHNAYDDTPLPIPNKQTISQPYVVAYMFSLLQLQPTDRVLEIGTGSGYAAALLSQIVADVYTVERHQNLVEYARKRLAYLHYNNVHVHHGDGTVGWAAHAPYNSIIVAAGAPTVPPTLKTQLAIGGRLVIPVGRKHQEQWLIYIERHSETLFEEQTRSPVAFVPLIGEEGWES